MKIKVCGMKFAENIKELEALHPDYMGFIFYQGSKRHLDRPLPRMDPSVRKTGVFVDEDLAAVLAKVRDHSLQAVQLHGDETPNYCLGLKKELQGAPVELIKAFPVEGDSVKAEELQQYENSCDYFLFDTKGKQRGGNGIQFNWKALTSYDLSTPYFLSGGIGPEDIEPLREFFSSDAASACYAVDVNSRFEVAPGLKDIEKLKRFIKEFKDLKK